MSCYVDRQSDYIGEGEIEKLLSMWSACAILIISILGVHTKCFVGIQLGYIQNHLKDTFVELPSDVEPSA